jgi:hypothetical protein
MERVGKCKYMLNCVLMSCAVPHLSVGAGYPSWDEDLSESSGTCVVHSEELSHNTSPVSDLNYGLVYSCGLYLKICHWFIKHMRFLRYFWPSRNPLLLLATRWHWPQSYSTKCVFQAVSMVFIPTFPYILLHLAFHSSNINLVEWMLKFYL